MTPKYERWVRELPFEPQEMGPMRLNAVMDSEWLGIDAHITYGTVNLAGRMGSEPYGPHTHDFDQVLLLAGLDMDDIGELGAEVQICLGEEMETHMITTTTGIAIPKGMPHYPMTVNRLDYPFVFVEVSVAKEYSEKPYVPDVQPTPPVDWSAKHRQQVINVPFMRKGAWNYGPANRDDGGGYVSFIDFNRGGIDMMIIYESMKRGPYRIGPDPDKPHTHATTQVMCFVGTDPEDMGDLGADFEICLGKEMEKHTFNRSTAVITQPWVPHWPGGIVTLDWPMVMCDIHPFGNKA